MHSPQRARCSVPIRRVRFRQVHHAGWRFPSGPAVPGRYVCNPFPATAETVTWTGACTGSFAQGTGTLTIPA